MGAAYSSSVPDDPAVIHDAVQALRAKLVNLAEPEDKQGEEANITLFTIPITTALTNIWRHLPPADRLRARNNFSGLLRRIPESQEDAEMSVRPDVIYSIADIHLWEDNLDHIVEPCYRELAFIHHILSKLKDRLPCSRKNDAWFMQAAHFVDAEWAHWRQEDTEKLSEGAPSRFHWEDSARYKVGAAFMLLLARASQSRITLPPFDEEPPDWKQDYFEEVRPLYIKYGKKHEDRTTRLARQMNGMSLCGPGEDDSYGSRRRVSISGGGRNRSGSPRRDRDKPRSPARSRDRRNWTDMRSLSHHPQSQHLSFRQRVTYGM